MSTSANLNGEPASTYFVQDRSNKDELHRVRLQDQMFTRGMGGTLSEQQDPTIFTSVLDIGCGTGGWLLEVAKTYPTISLLTGIDISGKMLAYARKEAESQKLADRVRFYQMDALQTLDFPNAHFDLVNQRSGGSYLRTWDWPKLLEEILRVMRPGGTIRLTEVEEPIESTSDALTTLDHLFFQVLYQAGHFFASSPTGLIDKAAYILNQYGTQDIQTRVHTLQYRAGTAEGRHFIEDMKLIHQTLTPFLSRWTRLPADHQETYQQMLKDFQQPDFLANWKLVTLWCHKAYEKNA